MRDVVEGIAYGILIALAALAVSFVGLRWARGADLPIPKPRPHYEEQCVAPDVKPYPGQTLQADATCPSGSRWKLQK